MMSHHVFLYRQGNARRFRGERAAIPCQRARSADEDSEHLDSLTGREKEILKMFAGGLAYDEIGEVRNNSRLTVRKAVSGIQKKLRFRTR